VQLGEFSTFFFGATKKMHANAMPSAMCGSMGLRPWLIAEWLRGDGVRIPMGFPGTDFNPRTMYGPIYCHRQS
jgi:hypothetical protein